MQFIFKIGPRHCPEGQFRPDDDGGNWVGIDFMVPKPQAILGENVRVEPEPGDEAWIWTHHNDRHDGGLKGQGVVGTATISEVKSISSDEVVVRFSDINIRQRKLHRKELARQESESPVVTALIDWTTSRSVALSPDQAAEFEGAVAAEDERFRQLAAIYGQNNSEAKPTDTDSRKEWSDVELLACLVAYLEMLGKEQSGVDYQKTDFRRALIVGPLVDRTEPAVEFRMRNISAFFADRAMPTIEGYVPAKNIGRGVFDRLERLYDQLGAVDPTAFSPTDDEDSLAEKIANLAGLNGIFAPVGNKKPARSQVTQSQFVRDPAVISAVLYHANGRCENCGAAAPFKKNDGSPYLEVHHVRFLADGGPDTIDNAAGLCPNCHRACHYADDRDKMRAALIGQLDRLVDYSEI